MSIFLPVTATCTKCGHAEETQLAASVNADRRPDLKAEILAGTFQAMECASCGTPIRLPAHLTYIDIERGQWFLVEDTAMLEQWWESEEEATELYEDAFGDAAPAVQREMGEEMQPRLVFGWTALREKLIAADAGIDDGALETLKVAILRSVPGPPLADRTELRLVGIAEDGGLRMQWVEGSTEEPIADLPVAREIYDDLVAGLASWEKVLTDLHAGLFVDMNRLLFARPVEDLAA